MEENLTNNQPKVKKKRDLEVERNIEKEIKEYKIILNELFKEETSSLTFLLTIGSLILQFIILLVLIFKK